MELIILVAFVFSVVWVYQDASALQKSGGLTKSDSSPIIWAIGCTLLWIAFFPIYVVVSRPRFKRQEKDAPGTEQPAGRFNCPECGESIPNVAKSCRYCQAVITDKDRPAKPAVRRQLKCADKIAADPFKAPADKPAETKEPKKGTITGVQVGPEPDK